MKIRHIAAILALLVLALLPLPARADVIWEPEDGFYAALDRSARALYRREGEGGQDAPGEEAPHG